MSFDKELLEILACPQCKGELTLTPEEDGLVCPACKQATRVGVRADANGKNERYCKKCNATVPRPDEKN